MDEDVRQVDAEYLRRNLGRCLAEGLTEIVERRPLDPIEFLVHWIHKYKLNNQLIQERSVYQRELEEQQRRVREESIHQKLLEDEQKQINDAHHQLKQIITEIAPEDLQSTNPPESDPVMKEVTQQSDPSQLIDSTAEDQEINKDESDEEADQSTDVDQTHEIPNNPQGQSEADSVSSEVNPVQDDEAQAEKTDEADSEERQTEMQIESEHENHSDTVEEHDDAVRPEDSAQPDVLQSDRQVKG
ncbi:DPY30 domain containing 2 isoform X5 [Misgurnus anguillicaudatus]|uniref:DPY30 domain containing 2 isoform X5 n=1 Tax=Misgurnus anguillicaudatus TaxID=75329 RepID=UPI003CCF861D